MKKHRDLLFSSGVYIPGSDLLLSYLRRLAAQSPSQPISFVEGVAPPTYYY